MDSFTSHYRERRRSGASTGGRRLNAAWGLTYSLRSILLVPVLLCPSPSDSQAAENRRADPSNYLEIVRLLRAGDTLLLAPGRYRNGLPLRNVGGTRDRPITISGPPPPATATFLARAGRNTISLSDSHDLVIRRLELDGDNLPVDAVKAEKESVSVHHITLENLAIINHGNNQQTVGISTKCPTWNWVIRGNTIIGAGTGIYLGDSDGSAPFIAGLIERNLIVDSIGYNLQIKHQQPRPDIRGMPPGRNVTIIRDNVFAKPNAGLPETARPSLLVGHWPIQGPGQDDLYAIYRNFFYQNRFEALFQGEGNVALYNNVMVNEFEDGLRIQPHNDVPRRTILEHNTIVAKGMGISVIRDDRSSGFPLSVRGNAVFSDGGVAGISARENLVGSMAAARSFLRDPFQPLGKADYRLRQRIARLDVSNQADQPSLPDQNRDFDGRPRLPGVPGAYASADRLTSGWKPTLTIKPEPAR